MILISNSLAKSGSTLLCNYQEELLDIAGIRNGQYFLRKYFNGRFIQKLCSTEAYSLMWLNLRYGNIVVKTHCTPTSIISLMQGSSLSKATYCYRDPRDVILSAIDHGKRSRDGSDKTGAFSSFENVLDAIPMVSSMLDNFYSWRKVPNTLFIRYEELMDKPEYQLRNMVDFLGWNVSEENIITLVLKHDSIKGKAWNFNKGTTQRWKNEMSPEEIERTTKAFYPFLEEMGYEL